MDARELRREVSAKRRAWAELCLHNWVYTYLVPPYARLLRDEGCDFHAHLCGWYDNALLPGGGLIGAIPRGHSKTTLCTIGGTLYAALSNKKKNITLIAKNGTEAKAKLRDIVTQLENNKLIQEDYGWAALPKMDKWKKAFVAANDAELILNGDVRIAIYPFMGPIRGQMHDGDRLELIVLDDPEDDKQVKSPIWRNDAWNWVNGALLPCLDPVCGSFVWLGTKVHKDSMLVRCLKDPGKEWPKCDIKAIDEHGNALWPARWSIPVLERERRRIGNTRFEQEYNNNPISDEDQTFKPGWWRYYPRHQLRFIDNCWHLDDGLTAQPRPLMVYGAHDPAFSDKSVQRSNSTGTVYGGYDERTNGLYMLRITEEKLTPARVLPHVVDEAKLWKPIEIAMEANLAQDILVSALQMSTWLPVRGVKHYSQKESRIRAMAQFVERGNMYLPAGEAETDDFLKEAEEWNGEGSPKDDRLDALAMLTQLIPFAPEDSASEIIEFTSRKREAERMVSGF